MPESNLQGITTPQRTTDERGWTQIYRLKRSFCTGPKVMCQCVHIRDEPAHLNPVVCQPAPLGILLRNDAGHVARRWNWPGVARLLLRKKLFAPLGAHCIVARNRLRNAESSLPGVAALTFIADFRQCVVNLPIAVAVNWFVGRQLIITRPSVGAD